MKAIEVKYLAPTDTRGARFKAFTEAGGLVEQYDYENDAAQARALAQLYIEKMGWRCHINGEGVLANGNYVYTLANGKEG